MKYSKLLKACTFIAILAGCSEQNEEQAPEEGAQKEDVRIAILNHILSTPFVAALIPDDDGLTCFDKAGLNPLINKRSKGPEIIDSIISKSVDFGTLAITPQIFQILQGNNLTIFSTYQTSDRDIKFIAKKSAGISSPEQITGKRIGYVGGTYGEIFLERYLEKHAIAKESVVLTSGGPAYLRDLFLNGDLDGAILWEPVVQDIILDQAVSEQDLFIDVDRSIYTARVNLLALPDILEANRSKAEKVVKALICAETYLINEPALVQSRLESWLGRQSDSLDGAFYPETFRLSLDTNSLQSDMYIESVWASTAVFSGKAVIPDDFSIYITDSIMREVAPSRIVK